MVTTIVKTTKAPRILLEEINKTSGFNERVQQIKQTYLDARPTISGERAWWMMQSYKETEGQHPGIRAARAFYKLLANMPIVIRDHELLVGGVTPHVRGSYPRVETHCAALLRRMQKETVSTASLATSAVLLPEDRERIKAAAEYWIAFSEAAWPHRRLVFTSAEKAILQSRMIMGPEEGAEGAVRGMGTTGITPGADYAKLFRMGYNGFIAEARENIARIRSKDRKDYTSEDIDRIEMLESMIIAMEGMVHFAHRHAALAREMAATEADPQRKKELLKIADVCENVPANPARCFHEALQVHWFVLIGQEIEKTMANALIGRFDQYCYPYYEKDIAEGRLTRQEAAELMGCMFMKWQSLEACPSGDFVAVVPGSYLANVSLGGVNRQGKDASNELSCLVLHVSKQVKTNQPHISLLWHRAMAPELIDKAIECTRDHGAGIPAWFNNNHVIEYLLDRGLSHDEARDGAITGCINICRPQSHTYCHLGGPGFIHHPKLLEMALNDGIEPFTGVRLGPATGDPRNFKTFDEVVEAYVKQYESYAEWMLKRSSELGADAAKHLAYVPFISATLDDCIARGKDANHGGERHIPELGAGTWTDRGLNDVGDCLIAIKKVVFEGGVPMATLLDAMKANWEGVEELRQKCLAAPKYGNDDDEVDSLLCTIWRYPTDWVQSHRDFAGRRPISFRQGAGWAQWAGKKVAALPNGRKAWTSLADASASPMQGADVKGPTAVLNSAAKLDTTYLEGPLLNMRFAPGPLRTKEGRMKFDDLVATYFDQGGFHVQFTIIDRDTLLDAKKHPQKYRTLVVRVAGYSAFWVELTPEVQDEIITRTDHQL